MAANLPQSPCTPPRSFGGEVYNVPVVPVRRRSTSSSRKTTSARKEDDRTREQIPKSSSRRQRSPERRLGGGRNKSGGRSQSAGRSQSGSRSQTRNRNQSPQRDNSLPIYKKNSAPSKSSTIKTVHQELKLSVKNLPHLPPKPNQNQNGGKSYGLMSQSLHERFSSLDETVSSHVEDFDEEPTKPSTYKKLSSGLSQSKLIRELKERHSQSSRSRDKNGGKRLSADAPPPEPAPRNASSVRRNLEKEFVQVNNSILYIFRIFLELFLYSLNSFIFIFIFFF